MKYTIFPKIAVATLLLIALPLCSACGEPNSTPTAKNLTSQPAPKAAANWQEKVSGKENPVVLLQTTLGDIYVELLPKVAPKTVANFLGLAEGTTEFKDAATGKMVNRPYYDGTLFFRVIPNFMIQGGDQTNSGSGSAGYKFEDEISATALNLDKQAGPADPRTIQGIAQSRLFKKYNITDQASQAAAFAKHGQKKINEDFNKEGQWVSQNIKGMSKRKVYEMMGYVYQDTLPSLPMAQGVLAMANSGPNTNGSQFFITEKDARHLDGKHTVFGRVLIGNDVVARITHVPVNGSRPKTDVVLTKVERLN